MNNYKITFELLNQLYINGNLHLDGILLSVYYMQSDDNKFGLNEGLNFDVIIDFPINIKEINIDGDKDFIYLASPGFYTELSECKSSMRKRLSEVESILYGDIVSKDKGYYKSYDMRYFVKVVDKIDFYCSSDDINQLELLIKEVYSIGKKSNRGYGKIKKYTIDEIENIDLFLNYKPLPMSKIDYSILNKQDNEYNYIISGYKPPYWHASCSAVCRVPKEGRINKEYMIVDGLY